MQFLQCGVRVLDVVYGEAVKQEPVVGGDQVVVTCGAGDVEMDERVSVVLANGPLSDSSLR